jgi:flagellar biosynthesis chaperone FliJ
MRAEFLLRATTAALLLATAGVAQAQGDPLQRAIGSVEQGQRAAAQSQERVDRYDDETRRMLERYRGAVWQAQQLVVYSQQIEQLAEAQKGDREALQRQIDEMERVERELLPLMLRMIDSLDSFIGLDLPFLPEERRNRVVELRRLMADPDVGTADKFRRILEAYRIEVDYGNGLGAERVEIDGRLMDQLRIGRTALFALALDAEQALRWDARAARWEGVESRYIPALREGLRIARETAAANLLVLPLPTAVAAEAGVQR